MEDPTLRVSTHRPLGLRLLAFFTGTALAAGALYIFLVFTSPGGMEGILNLQKLPKELRSAVLVTARGESANIYAPASFWYDRLPLGAGTSQSISRSQDSFTAVTKQEAGASLVVNNTTVYDAAREIATPSLAPNAPLIVYAAKREEEGHDDGRTVPPQVSAGIPGQWEIHVRLLRDGSDRVVVPGYAPRFVSDTQFVFFTTGGLHLYDLTNGSVTTLLAQPFPLVLDPVLVSPDRTLIAFRDPPRKATVVYRLDNNVLTLVRSEAMLFTAPALSNDGLYDVRGTAQGAQVWRYAFDGSAPLQVHLFPPSMSISRILF